MFPSSLPHHSYPSSPLPPVDVLMCKTLFTSEAAVLGSRKENKPLVISSCYYLLYFLL